jgi:hypothetical protein
MSADDTLEHYHYIWDGTQHWVLTEGIIPREVVYVHFKGDTPSMQELMALRKLLPEFQHMPVQALKKQLGNLKTLILGAYYPSESLHMVHRAMALDLKIEQQDQSYTGYIPYHPNTGSLLILNHLELLARIVDKLLLPYLGEACR